MKLLTMAIMLVAAVSLGGWSNQRWDHRLSGTGLGLAGGAAVAMLAGGPVAATALVGGVAGGVLGDLGDKYPRLLAADRRDGGHSRS